MSSVILHIPDKTGYKHQNRRMLMSVSYAEEFRPDLPEFREKTRQFYNHEMSVAEYKGFSGGFGTYAQRGGNYGMIRLRLCGGRITRDKLRFITDSIRKYQINRVHLTTCQSVQLHNLNADTICSLVEEAWDHDIITRGGGGDYPRNVMVSPLTGVEPGEPFDLTPYADAAADYLLGFVKTLHLPRKLKVCFSNSEKNYPHATFRDLGFVAKENRTFDVYSAGGLGNNPKMGVKVASGVAPDKILYYIKAMADTFMAYGNYENRAKARTRYMQDTLGADGYCKAYREKLAAVLEQENLDLAITPVSVCKQGDGTIEDPRVTAQKQDGLYAVSYHPIGGNPAPEKLIELCDAIEPMESVELRVTPDEGLYFINCTAKETEKLLSLTDDGARTRFETSVACIGNSICQVGARDSQQLLSDCIHAVRPYHFADGVLPRIRISGCPSSCSAHQIADLGFRGAVLQTASGPVPAFALFENGCDLQGSERFGADLGVMASDCIPAFLTELGQTISAAGSTWDSWILEHHDAFLALVRKYQAVN